MIVICVNVKIVLNLYNLIECRAHYLKQSCTDSSMNNHFTLFVVPTTNATDLFLIILNVINVFHYLL